MSSPTQTAPPEQQPQHYIGKYRVVHFIGAGGMAEVWLCRRSGIGGFEKPVVIKRILASFAADPDFVRMFLDEARVAAGLMHPNIVQVYDIDTDQDVPFIAMEYVHGPSFQALLSKARKVGGQGFGTAAAVRVICDVAAGLHYAHNATDAEGESLGLVHRDVSPHNILVAAEGTAKLLDFGVAKSKGRLSSTQAGTIKGKISHMAPEQARNAEIDHRADVYSLGVCLYEATTGRLPFGGDNDVQRLMQIIEGHFPKPTDLVLGYPPELEKIVLAAMHSDPDQRTPTAQALQQQLEAYAAQAQLGAGHTSVKTRVAELFPREGSGSKPGFQVPGSRPGGSNGQGSGNGPGSGPGAKAGSGSKPGLVLPPGLTPSRATGDFYRSPPRTLSREQLEAISNPANPTSPSSPTLPVQGAPPPPEIAGGGWIAAPLDEVVDVNLDTQSLPAPTAPPATSAPRRGSKAPLVAGAVGLLVAAGGLYFLVGRSPPPPSPPVLEPVQQRTRDDEVQAAIDEATRLLEERRHNSAVDLLTHARSRPATSPALNRKVSELLDAAAAESALDKARTVLGAKDFDAALELANTALARDPGNAEALRIIGEARAGKASSAAAAPAPTVAKAPAKAPGKAEHKAPKRAAPQSAGSKPPASGGGFDSESLLPTDPDALLPPSKN